MDSTLEQRIQDQIERGCPFPEWQIWFYFIQVCRGVNYLNVMNIIHNDLTSDNIMIEG